MLAGCGAQNPGVSSDSGHDYGGSPTQRVDLHYYVLAGTVAAEPSSLTRQTRPGGGSVSGYGGYVSGSFWGPLESGKGFVRVHVESSNAPLAPVGQVVLLKTTDTKAVALLPGDKPTFKCRAQQEAVAAVQNGETYHEKAAETWELDDCRLVTPAVGTGTP